MSPSVRGRGLKYTVYVVQPENQPSPSVRGRGLKSLSPNVACNVCIVALRARAWIEIGSGRSSFTLSIVALRARAWIEIP